MYAKLQFEPEDLAHIERHEEWLNTLAMAIGRTAKANLDILSRVEALEAERVAPVQAPSTVPTPPAAVPSDDELCEVQLKARRRAQPDAARKCVMMDQAEAARRALYDHGYQQGLAAGRAEQGSSQGILDDSTPEPSQAPAGDGGLVDTIADIIENEPIIGRPPELKWKPEARAVLLAVAQWLRSVGNHGSATDLEREAQR